MDLAPTQSKYTVKFGHHITLECALTGGPPPHSIAWQTNEHKKCIVPDDKKYLWSTLNKPSLTILNADENDKGTYMCIATLRNGRKVKSPVIKLVVNTGGM